MLLCFEGPIHKMTTSGDLPVFTIGDSVRVGGRSRYRGRVGIVQRLCMVKVGVKLSGEAKLLYYLPNTLHKVKSNEKAGNVSNGCKFDIEVEKLLTKSYLSGLDILDGVSKGRNKSDALTLINILLTAWKDASEAIVGGGKA